MPRFFIQYSIDTDVSEFSKIFFLSSHPEVVINLITNATDKNVNLPWRTNVAGGCRHFGRGTGDVTPKPEPKKRGINWVTSNFFSFVCWSASGEFKFRIFGRKKKAKVNGRLSQKRWFSFREPSVSGKTNKIPNISCDKMKKRLPGGGLGHWKNCFSWLMT